jgi:hypothetical protein
VEDTKVSDRVNLDSAIEIHNTRSQKHCYTRRYNNFCQRLELDFLTFEFFRHDYYLPLISDHTLVYPSTPTVPTSIVVTPNITPETCHPTPTL